MKYKEGSQITIAGIRCEIVMASVYGHALIAPLEDGHTYVGEKILRGVVFAIIDHHGVDQKTGIRIKFDN